MTETSVLDKTREAELATLGSLILDSTQAAHVIATLKPEHFSVKLWGQAYAIIIHLAERGNIDPLILKSEFQKQGIRIGTSEISEWLDAVPTGCNSQYYARLVHEAWQERRMNELCAEVSERLGFEPVDEIRHGFIKELECLAKSNTVNAPTAKEVIIANREANVSEPVKTGYARLDGLLTGGLDRQSLTVVGAATSVGKSQFALNLLARATYQGKPARGLYIVQEMSPQMVEDRLVATFAKIEIGAACSIRTGLASSQTQQKVGRDYCLGLEQFSKMPLRIHARGAINAHEFSSLVAHFAKELDLVVLDYLQQCSCTNSQQTTRDRIEEISRVCKQTAARHNIPVIALAQLSREGARAGHNATIASFKSFCTWMKQQGRIPNNPVSRIRTLNQKADRRLIRRALTTE